ncbi:MAG: hypothetical protein AB7D96_10245 [Arcobacteraceae bacterium]
MPNKHKSVENIIAKESKITFILESPHKNEICEGYPLAGKAGREISKILIEKSELPFGKEAKEGSLINKVSIINVSQVPLQGSAYCCEKNKPSNINIYEKLKKLIEQGADFSTQHKELKLNQLKEKIYNSCLDELEKLPDKTFIVPCGKFAREFYKKAKTEESIKGKKFELIDKDIPHPARGQWSGISEETIKIIKAKI